MKLTLSLILPGALLILGFSGIADAFHSGGVANCDGCHSMHAPKVGGSFLLIATDTSSTCLTCHAHADTFPLGFHVMTYPVPAAGVAPVELTPGGDFAWLSKNFTYTIGGVTTIKLGQTHGHNVIAADFGLIVDSDFPNLPAGAFVSSPSVGNLAGSLGNSYLSLVPFFENNRGYVILKTHASNAYFNTPGMNNQMSCPCCHRVHASGWPNMMRWNMQSGFITFVDGAGNPVWPGLDTTPTAPELALGCMSSETMVSYHNRLPTLFGAFQRVLCNKCHAQDWSVLGRTNSPT